MPYKQVKAFDQSKGGRKPGYCLQNVRLGYGVAPKYDDATAAWDHTQQHKDRNVPTGIDVPVYYSYTTKNGNEGHINVRLANGQVWSDGNLYASIEDYEARKAPRFLGWGESVNDVRVVQYVPDPAPVKHVETVKGGPWNVRNAPNLNASIRDGKVLNGQVYDTVVDTNGWRKIHFRGAVGYVGPKAWV